MRACGETHTPRKKFGLTDCNFFEVIRRFTGFGESRQCRRCTFQVEVRPDKFGKAIGYRAGDTSLVEPSSASKQGVGSRRFELLFKIGVSAQDLAFILFKPRLMNFLWRSLAEFIVSPDGFLCCARSNRYKLQNLPPRWS